MNEEQQRIAIALLNGHGKKVESDTPDESYCSCELPHPHLYRCRNCFLLSRSKEETSLQKAERELREALGDSDTPMTDAESIYLSGSPDAEMFAPSSFARGLERELSASHAVIRELYEALEGLMEWNGVYDVAVSKASFPSLAEHFMDRGQVARQALAHAKEKGVGR